MYFGGIFLKSNRFYHIAMASALATSAIVIAPPAHAASVFSDVKNVSSEEGQAIINLAQRGIISGYPDGTFKPENSITRTQAAKILAGILKLDTVHVKNPNFKDIKPGDPNYGAIAALANAGIISGSHTYSFINAENERVWVKFHFRTEQNIKNLTGAEAAEVISNDRESSQRDLYEAIEKGDFPKWKMYIQVMTEEQARELPYNPFDLTKVWYKKDFPLIPVGEFELNKNADNYFAEVEQAAFAPSNIIPGISFSPDKMLQARIFAYADAQRYRLGVNHYMLPVNAPKCPFRSFHRDGAMRFDGNLGSTLSYEPNSYGEWEHNLDYKEPELRIDGNAGIHDFREDDNNYFEQPGKLFRLMTAEEQQRLFENTANDMASVEEFIKRRHILHCYLADPAYGEGVAKAMGLSLEGMDLSNPYEKQPTNV